MTGLPFGFNQFGTLRLIITERFKFHRHIAAQYNISAAPGHIGGDRHRCRFASLCDDVGFTLVLLRIQHLVIDLVFTQQSRQVLRGFN